MLHILDRPRRSIPCPLAKRRLRASARALLFFVLLGCAPGGLLGGLPGCGASPPTAAPSGPTGAASGEESSQPSEGHGASGPASPRFVSIATSTDAACALEEGGTLRCWGARLGPTPQPVGEGVEALLGVLDHDGTNPSSPRFSACRREAGASVGCGPVSGRPVRALADLGLANACALLGDGTVACWGNRADAASGDGPLHPVAGLSGVASAGFGWRLACGIVEGGQVRCWGPSMFSTPDLVPIALPAPARSIAAGDDHACAALVGGRVACWGGMTSQAIGDLSARRSDTNVAVIVPGLTGATSVAAGGTTSCAIVDGAVICWGRPLVWDAEGCAHPSSGPTPRRIAGPEHVQQLSLQREWGCALEGEGAVWCFGHAEEGQLGEGTVYSAHASSAARRVRREPASASGCLPAASRAVRELRGVGGSEGEVGFCAGEACLAVDLASGRYRSAERTPQARREEPVEDGILGVDRVGDQLEACWDEERCVRIRPSAAILNDERSAVVEVAAAGLLVAASVETRSEGSPSLLLEGFSRATRERVYSARLEVESSEVELRAVGPHLLASYGQWRVLLDPRTGRERRNLHQAVGNEALVFDAGGGSMLLTDRAASYVEVLAPDGTARARDLAQSQNAHPFRVGDALVIVRGAPLAGDVEVIDARTGAERAHLSPPLCEAQLPPLDACAPH